MPEDELKSILKKYGRLTIKSDCGYYIVTLFGDDDAVFSSGCGSPYNALIEIYDDLRFHLILKTGSVDSFR